MWEANELQYPIVDQSCEQGDIRVEGSSMTREQAEILRDLKDDLRIMADSPATPVNQAIGLLAEAIKQLSARS